MKCISAELAASRSEADVNALPGMGCIQRCSIEGSHFHGTTEFSTIIE